MIDIVLLVLKVGVLVLLYLFIWYVVKRAVGNVRTPAGGAVVAAPDIALPDASRPLVAVTTEERDARRESRAQRAHHGRREARPHRATSTRG